MSFSKRTGKSRSPKEIATAILATEIAIQEGFPVNFESVLKEFTSKSFRDEYPITSTDPDMATGIEIVKENENFKLLLQTLKRIRSGDASRLGKAQKNAIRDSYKLINLLIKDNEYLGSMNHDSSITLTEADDLWSRMASDAKGRDPDVHSDEMKAKNAQQAYDHSAITATYRMLILRQLEELAGALHIPFDKPKGRG